MAPETRRNYANPVQKLLNCSDSERDMYEMYIYTHIYICICIINIDPICFLSSMDPKKPRGFNKIKANLPFEKPSAKWHFKTQFSIRKPRSKTAKVGTSGPGPIHMIFPILEIPVATVPCQISLRLAPVFWCFSRCQRHNQRCPAIPRPHEPWPQCLPTTFARRCLRVSDISCRSVISRKGWPGPNQEWQWEIYMET